MIGRVCRSLAGRNKDHVIDIHLKDQFAQGRWYASLASRPGQSGRADGYILEGKELDFYSQTRREEDIHDVCLSALCFTPIVRIRIDLR